MTRFFGIVILHSGNIRTIFADKMRVCEPMKLASSILFATVAVLALGSCQVAGPVAGFPAPVAADRTVVDRAGSCGEALAYAASCNLMRDDADFALARYDIVQSWRQSYPPAQARDAETAFDMAVLATLREVRSCSLAPSDAERVAGTIRQRLASCQAP